MAQFRRLTGINSDMVQGAPVFAEIADSFMQFMGGGIFVAHSVNLRVHLIRIRASRTALPLPEALHLRGNAATLSRP
jgi:DNA polymerase III epsilon subunit-like protein